MTDTALQSWVSEILKLDEVPLEETSAQLGTRSKEERQRNSNTCELSPCPFLMARSKCSSLDDAPWPMLWHTCPPWVGSAPSL